MYCKTLPPLWKKQLRFTIAEPRGIAIFGCSVEDLTSSQTTQKKREAVVCEEERFVCQIVFALGLRRLRIESQRGCTLCSLSLSLSSLTCLENHRESESQLLKSVARPERGNSSGSQQLTALSQLARSSEMNLDISRRGEEEEGPAPTEDGPTPFVKTNYTPARQQRAQRSSSSSSLLHAGGRMAGSPPPPPRRRSSMMSAG